MIFIGVADDWVVNSLKDGELILNASKLSFPVSIETNNSVGN